MRVCEYVYSSTARRARVMTSRDVSEWYCVNIYGVATISRLLVIIGLFCRIQSLLYGSFAKETYDLKEPTNYSIRYSVRILYGVATISRRLKIIGLLCKRAI